MLSKIYYLESVRNDWNWCCQLLKSYLKPGAAAYESSLDSVLYAAKNLEVCPHLSWHHISQPLPGEAIIIVMIFNILTVGTK